MQFDSMGTPPTPMYATLYFAIHEDKIIRRFLQLRFYRRYIDDGFGIWISNRQDAKAWREFKQLFDTFGNLSWTFSPLETKIDYLDITIGLDSTGRICTTLFEKALDLYLYLPPHSSPPQWSERSGFWLVLSVTTAGLGPFAMKAISR
jgi:hypothetical protein